MKKVSLLKQLAQRAHAGMRTRKCAGQQLCKATVCEMPKSSHFQKLRQQEKSQFLPFLPINLQIASDSPQERGHIRRTGLSTNQGNKPRPMTKLIIVT